jgi:hypothetical protein
VISHRTSYQKRKQYRIPLRYRECSGVPFWAADLEALRTLRRETLGSMHPFLFVLDDEPMLVQFGPDTHEETASWVDLDHEDERGQGVVEHPITLEEVSNGISLLS